MLWIIFKVKNPFWSLQPVIHYYQFWSIFRKPGVINPNFNIYKFINNIDITTLPWSDINGKAFQKHISQHFLKKPNIHYDPLFEKQIEPYFKNDSNAYVSYYNKNGLLMGSIANRTLRIHINTESFLLSYIDFLCVHQEYRKKLVAPELIQTHEYFQRNNSKKKCLVSMFKKEGKLTNIVPLVRFTTYSFDKRRTNIHSYYNNIDYLLPSGVHCIQITKSNIQLLIHFLGTIRNEFSCFVISPLETIDELINKNTIHCYTIIQSDEIIGAYFFRETGVFSNSSIQNIECFASLNNSSDDKVFIDGFHNSLAKLREKYTVFLIEELAHNTVIINDLIEKRQIFPTFTTPCAYYIYNYYFNTINNGKCCFIM